MWGQPEYVKYVCVEIKTRPYSLSSLLYLNLLCVCVRVCAEIISSTYSTLFSFMLMCCVASVSFISPAIDECHFSNETWDVVCKRE